MSGRCALRSDLPVTTTDVVDHLREDFVCIEILSRDGKRCLRVPVVADFGLPDGGHRFFQGSE